MGDYNTAAALATADPSRGPTALPPCASTLHNPRSHLAQHPQSCRPSRKKNNLALETNLTLHECGYDRSQLTNEAVTEVKEFCLTAVNEVVLLCWSHNCINFAHLSAPTPPLEQPPFPSCISCLQAV